MEILKKYISLTYKRGPEYVDLDKEKEYYEKLANNDKKLLKQAGISIIDNSSKPPHSKISKPSKLLNKLFSL